MMGPVAPHFQPQPSDVLDLINRHPLAWVVGPDLSAIPLPIRPTLNGDGELAGFHGHMPRRLTGSFDDDPTVLLLFSGAEAYLSPSWFANRRQAPTWASQSAAFRCSIRFIEEPDALRESLSDLINSQEEGRANGWSLKELGERYQQLARFIIPFRCEILESRIAFRLGQDEDEQTFADVIAGLVSEGNAEFAALMQSFRPASPQASSLALEVAKGSSAP